MPGGLRYLSEELKTTQPIGRGSPAPQRTTRRPDSPHAEATLQHVHTAKAKSILCSEAGFDLFKDDDIVLEKDTEDILQEDAARPSVDADDTIPELDLTAVNGFKIRDEAVREEMEEEEYMTDLLQVWNSLF